MKTDRRGVALIITFMVVVVLTILGVATISRSVSERFLTQRYAESTQAFWLAEAGVNRALYELKTDYSLVNYPLCDANDLSCVDDNCGKDCKFKCSPNDRIIAGALTLGEYYACVKELNATQREVIAHGCIPSTTPTRAERKISVLIEGSGIIYAIDTTGTFKITGSQADKLRSSSHENSTLDFEEVFRMTKDAVKAIAEQAAAEGNGHVYTNPPTNQQPVNGITWVELTGSNKYVISSTWSGSGLLIVNGNGMNLALEITGDWTFTGMIWVIGKLKIAGTPQITGAIFAESVTGIESDLSGNPTISFNSTDVASAFSLLGEGGAGGAGGVKVLSWREI